MPSSTPNGRLSNLDRLNHPGGCSRGAPTGLVDSPCKLLMANAHDCPALAPAPNRPSGDAFTKGPRPSETRSEERNGEPRSPPPGVDALRVPLGPA